MRSIMPSNCAAVAVVLSSFSVMSATTLSDKTSRSYHHRECPVASEIIAIRPDPADRGHYARVPYWNGTDKGHRRALSSRHATLRGTRQTKDDHQDDNDRFSLGTLSVDDVIEPEEGPSTLHDYTRELEHTILARSCSCYDLRPVLCPLEVDHCAVIRRYNASRHGPSPLVCLDQTETMDEFSETTFLIVVLWYSVILCCIVCTRWGRNCLHCLLAHCVPGYNRCLARFLLYRERELAQDMMYRHVSSRRNLTMQRLQHVSPELASELVNGQWTMDRSHHQTPRNESTPSLADRPIAWALKTRIFATNDEQGEATVDHDDGDEFDHDCIICFQSVEDGDVVGDLTCQHVFHADCLKTWLKRRNACPLCNAREVAAPRSHPGTKPPKSEEETGSDTESRISSEPTTENPPISQDSASDSEDTISQVTRST